jgi:hypothetical protein
MLWYTPQRVFEVVACTCEILETAGEGESECTSDERMNKVS